ncbi:DUF4232 domain-containing protein [Saccharopolyspora taberi]|uniref:DUF4232 domain-containing protein n=1 Tax=Saccharopolyspora taberi TaxID=60895 RepID=A0ABN3V7X8_9PSEU
MRKRLVGTVVAVAAGMALSGCAAGGPEGPSAPIGGGQAQGQQGGQPEQESQEQSSSESATGDSGDNGRAARPCEASDLDAKFSSHEQAGEFASSGSFFVTKTSNDMTPCVLDGYADVKFMAGSEGGSTLPVKVEKTTDDNGQAVPMVLEGFGDQASFNLTWTAAQGCGDTPGALSVTPPEAGEASEVRVNTGAENKMSVCSDSTVRLVEFGDYTG